MSWFGNFPEYFEIFARSVIANPILSYHIWTDQDLLINCKDIPNLFFYKISFIDYCKRVSETLKIEFHPIHPYKLCDIRSWQALIHEKELENFDFIGFGDIDLILGDMQSLITPIIKKVEFFQDMQIELPVISSL